jgi:two-component sensor histidine kinase
MRELDLRMALRDQQVLLGEMDHRVKNSLQSVQLAGAALPVTRRRGKP